MTWESHHAISTLVFRYAECIDNADFEGLGALFARATLRAEGTPFRIEGTAAVTDYYRSINRVHADGTLGTRHLTTNLIIEIDEAADAATARSYFCVVQGTERIALQPIAMGSYRDCFHRVDGQWHFHERVMVPSRFGDLSDHLTFDPNPRATFDPGPTAPGGA